MTAPLARPKRNTLLKRSSRLAERVAEIREAMSAGKALHLMYHKGERCWCLSSGEVVRRDVAKILIRDPLVHPDDDGLFPGMPQTWRAVGS